VFARVAAGAAALFAGVEPATAQEEEEPSADQVQACASAYEQAQVNRNAGKLVEAQEHLRICVQDSCPDFVKTDCGQWLSDIKRDVPSVVFSVVDATGKELVDAKLSVDGKEVALDGRPVEFDPGQHEVTYEVEGKSYTEKVVIRQGEKNRVLELKLKAEADSDADGIVDSADACPTEVGVAEAGGCPKAAPPPPAAKVNESMRLGAYIGWGVGGAGLATFAVFGLLAKSKDEEARNKCLNTNACSQGEVNAYIDEVDSKNLIANIGLGVGIAGAAAGTVLFFLSMPSEEKSGSDSALNLGVTPLVGGGAFSFSSQF
jgi:hypothetical protein